MGHIYPSEHLSSFEKQFNLKKKLAAKVKGSLLPSHPIFWFFIDLTVIFITSFCGVAFSPWGKLELYSFEMLTFLGFFSISFCSIGIGIGLYDKFIRIKIKTVVIFSLVCSLLSSIIAFTIVYFIFYKVIGRQTILYAFSFSFSISILLKIIVSWFIKKNPYRYTVVGESALIQEIVKFFEEGLHTHFIYIPLHDLPSSSPEEVQKILRDRNINDVVIDSNYLVSEKNTSFAINLIKNGTRVVRDIDFYINIFERIPLDFIEDHWLFKDDLNGRKLFEDLLKRIFDIVFSILGIFLSLPILIIAALIIKGTSPGPIFYTQTRAGRFFKPFKLFKLRTMSFSSKELSPKFTEINDQRVTYIGKFLRPLHLDELPQLINVLLGDMSLIGPRPEALYFAEKMSKEIPLYGIRYIVKPGITGFAQINLGYVMDTIEGTKKKLAFDLYYIDHYSVILDFFIFLKTAFKLVKDAR